MHIFNTLAPVMFLIAFGYWLAKREFIGTRFVGELNKLVYWVALPALVFRAASSAGMPQGNSLWMAAAMIGATVVGLVVSLSLSAVAGFGVPQKRTFVECSFFGNIAYIGLPILAHSMGLLPLGDRPEMLASGAVTMTIMTVVNNLLVVRVMEPDGMGPVRIVRHLVSNPVVLAGALGLVWGTTGVSLPVSADRALQTLGGFAVPGALLCIGGSLLRTPLHGRLPAITAASLVKIAVMPLAAWALARWIGLSPADTRVVLVFMACPTAVAAYTMASQMGGDEPLAAGTIAVTTIVAFASLTLALAVT